MMTGIVFYLFIVRVCIVPFSAVMQTVFILILEASCYFINSFSFRLRNQKKGKGKEKGQQCHENQEGVRKQSLLTKIKKDGAV